MVDVSQRRKTLEGNYCLGDKWRKVSDVLEDSRSSLRKLRLLNKYRLYVQLSRVPSLDMVFILRPFDAAELRRPLSDELLAELAWEEEMAEKTKRLYGM